MATLFTASVTGAITAALASVAFLPHAAGFATAWNLELLVDIFGPPGVQRFGGTLHEFGFSLQSLLSKSFDLSLPGSLLRFAALVTAVMLLLFWGVCALLAPLVAAAARLSAFSRRGSLVRLAWKKAYPLGVLVAACAPAVLVAVHRALYGRGAVVIAGSSLSILAIVYLLLLRALNDPERVQRFLRVSLVCSLALAALTWTAAGVATALKGDWRAPSRAAAGSPNILLVSIDSLRSDHVHCYGYARETTPTIDALAREGTRFHTVVSPTSWTLPAHLTLLTSLPPEKHGVVDDTTRLGARALFLAEVLRRAGYATAGFVSAPYLDSAYDFSQGFEHYDDYTIAKRSFDDSEHTKITSPTLVRIVSDWLARWDRGGRERPFFIFTHMWDVHYDYTPPPPYNTMFDPDYRGSVSGKNYWYGTQVHKGMDPRDLQHIIALYDGEIRYTDLYLGYVVGELRKLGVLDQTIVVVTADHGDEFFEHGRKGHKQALYDESILVPLVMRFPAKVPAGRVVEDQVRLMDIAPTIVALAGLVLPPEFGPTALHGPQAPQNLVPWMTADSAATLPALPAFSDLVGDAPVPIAAIRTPALKLIQELEEPGKEELFDLVADPGEQKNLAGTDHADATLLRQKLARWRQACHGGPRLERKVTLSDDQKERLRALGYLK